VTEFSPRTEPRRDRYGRYIIPDPMTGKDREWTRATTLSGVLPDRFGLERWAQRMVVFGLSRRDDLVVLAQSVQSTTDYDDKKRLDKIAKEAKDAAKAGEKANIGTAVHTFTELLDRGQLPAIPAAYAADIKAYREMQRAYGFEVLSAEQIVVNTELGVAGTYDRLVKAPGFDLPVILDIKTGGTVDFSHLEHSIQLGIYANADHTFDVATGKVHPREPVDRQTALIVHLPAGKGQCTVHELDIERGWELAQVAKTVYEARRDKTLSKRFNPRG
jgi:hypothetical protein